MGEFQAPWLNKGEPIETSELPFAGVDAVGRVRKEFAEVTTTYKRLMSLYTYGVMASVLNLIEESGVGPAKEAWEQHLEETGLPEEARKEMTFPEDDFAEDFTDLVKNNAIKNLDTDESANTLIEDNDKLNQAIEDEIQAITDDTTLTDLKQDMQRLEMERAIVEFYWRHRHDKHQITIPEKLGDDGNVEEWDVREFTQEHIREVMTFEDWKEYRAADATPDIDPQDQVNDFLDPDDEDELKKS